MPRLIVYKNSEKYKEVSFINMVTIGRDNRNDIVLEEPEISNFHASIYIGRDGNYILCDQSSRNFTRVNGKRIRQYRLSYGASFQIVDYLFSFLRDAGKKPPGKKVRLNRRILLPKETRTASDTVFRFPKILDASPTPKGDSQNRLALLISFFNEMLPIRDYYELIEKVLSISIKMMGGRRGFIALTNKDGDLDYIALQGFEGGPESLQVSYTMIQKVLNKGCALLTANAVKDSSLNQAKSVLSYRLKSVMCVPLQLDEKIIGCNYLDNPEAVGSFGDDDLEFFQTLANQIAIVIDNGRYRKEIEDNRKELIEHLELKDHIVLNSESEKQLHQEVRKVAPADIPVLITGETGTGKEMIAKSLHHFSKRKGAFIPINCAAIPDTMLESELFGYEAGAYTDAKSSKPGYFELAQGGTLFLDEIGDMPLSLQPKLLRVIHEKSVTRLGSTEEKKIDVRVLSATNRDLKAMTKEGKFRPDLYYRLTGYTINTDPLRERREDILTLANFFLLRSSQEFGRKVTRISRKARKMLMAYDWPGNVNELHNAINGAILRSDGCIVNPEDLPDSLHDQAATPPRSFPTLAENEKRHIERALRKSGGNKKAAAEILKIGRQTLYEKIKKYGIGESASKS